MTPEKSDRDREREINHNSDTGFYSLGSSKSEGGKKRRIRQQ
jgi:hypothetical protein